mgnify:CR=1 FL=1
MTDDREPGRKSSRRAGMIAGICAAVVVGMVGMSFAAVPLYRIFCAVTGYAGTTQRAEAGPGDVVDREITVRFDSNVSRDLPWDVKPEMRRMKLKLGETGQTFYLARNDSGAGVVGTSSFNVSPPAAGMYFNKIECFCFTEQPLQAGEEKEMGVVFFVDPAMLEDADTATLSEITLSYTFFPAQDQAGAAKAASENETTPAVVGG